MTQVGDARALPADDLGDLRRRVVASVEDGLAQVEAARRYGVSRQTVGLWVRDYRNRGEGAFRPGRRGRKPGEQLALTPAQQLAVAHAVADGPPESAGLDHLVWSRQAVIDFVRAHFAITLGVTTAGNYLVRWGFPLPQDLLRTLRRTALTTPPDAFATADPAPPPYADPAPPPYAEAAWLPGAEVVWVGHNTPTWCPEAPRPTLLHAVSNRGALTFLTADPTDATAVHDFVARLVRQAARRLNVVVTWQPEGHARTPRLITFGPGPRSDSDSGPRPGPGFGMGSASGPVTSPGSDSAARSDTDPGSDTDLGFGPGPGPGSDTSRAPSPGPRPDTAPGSDTGTASDSALASDCADSDPASVPNTPPGPAFHPARASAALRFLPRRSDDVII